MRSLINIGSNLDAPQNIRKAVEILEPESTSRVFVTESMGSKDTVFHNLSILTSREYSQEELRKIEATLGRSPNTDDFSKIAIDLDLQVTGDWKGDEEAKSFKVACAYRDDWMNKGYVAVPTSEIIREFILPDDSLKLVLPQKMLPIWLREIIGGFPLDRMPLIEGGIVHHQEIMNQLLEFVKDEWRAPDSPIAAMIVHNGRIIGRALSQGRTTEDCTGHAEMVALRDTSRSFGRSQLKESWLYTTHAPCSMCREAAFESGVRGVVWAIDSYDAPAYYKELHSDPITAFSNRAGPTLYRGVQRERAQKIISELELQLPVRPQNPVVKVGVELQLDTPNFYDRFAREYLDPEIHPVAYEVSRLQFRLRQTLSDMIPGYIADVGCGCEIPPVTGKFIGIDISPEMVAERKRRIPHEQSYQGSATQIPLAGGSVEGVFAPLVIDHLTDIEAAIKEFYRILKPKGAFELTLLRIETQPEFIYAQEMLRMKNHLGQVFSTPVVRRNEESIIAACKKCFSHLGTEIMSLRTGKMELMHLKFSRVD
jgi:tRNA(Arg) A34 adenosine deaminase TadA/7,8-dihydro-6-hydroxymethylpterin-pyrophosphokinase/SAM-dependent methyltransferase